MWILCALLIFFLMHYNLLDEHFSFSLQLTVQNLSEIIFYVDMQLIYLDATRQEIYVIICS